MSDLFVRTVSQGLQGFLPIAVYLAWAQRRNGARLTRVIRWGTAAALLLTPAAGYLFQHTAWQARWEAVLATLAAAITVRAGLYAWRPESLPSRPASSDLSVPAAILAATAAMLIVTRQTMEIDAVFVSAALDVRSLDATVAICTGVMTALAASAIWMWSVRRSTDQVVDTVTRAFGVLFLAQVLLYAFHESAEAGFLPWSEILHAATEPYSPDGMYGKYFSLALIGGPLMAALGRAIRDRREGRASRWVGWVAARPRTAWTVAGLLVAATIGLLKLPATGTTTSVAADSPAVASVDHATIAAAPRLLFRHTGVDRNYGMVAETPLDRPGSQSVTSSLRCERVSYGAGRGICLQADRGVFTTFRAVLFDQAFAATHTIALDGSPSRTKISADGRVGAITVFVTGQAHGYSGGSFSTKTTLVDMASGDVIGDLEEFSTWRDGRRFKAADFNFWGVTFTRDSNVFYATLRTAQQSANGKEETYLVRGELGLRKLTVLRANLECPSLSPNNRLIVFKKKVAASLNPWRLYVLDLTTMQERAVEGETRSIDDQIEWLDDAHILYAAPRPSEAAVTDVWVAPIDGSGPARPFLQQAWSPIVVH